MNCYYSRKSEAGITLIVIITVLFRLWLISGVPKMLIAAPHDDLYYGVIAHHLANGEWMGQYDQMTLIKGPFYAFFVVLSSYLSLPLMLSETLFYVGACFVIFCALSPLIKNAWFRFVIFILLLFCPASLATNTNLRVYREFVFFSLSLYVLATSFGLFLRIEGKISSIIAWSLGLGLSMGAFLITREESIWIFPSVIFLLSVSFFVINRKKAEYRSIRTGILLASVLIWYIPLLIVSSLNYRYYGYWGFSELLDRDFNRIVRTLGSIKTSEWYPYSPVTREGIEMAALASPRFGALKPQMDSLWDIWADIGSSRLSLRPEWYFKKYPIKPGEMGGHFTWFFRDVLAHKGYFDGGKFPRQRLFELADELEAACAKGSLECSNSFSLPFVGSFSVKHIPIILDFMVYEFQLYIHFDHWASNIFTLDTNSWDPYDAKFVVFNEIVNNPIDYHSVNGNTDFRLDMLAYKEKLMYGIQGIYKKFTLPMLVFFSCSSLTFFLAQVSNRGIKIKDDYWLSVIFLYTAIVFTSRLTTLALVSATSNVPSNYGASNYIYLYVMIFVMAVYTANHITRFLKAKPKSSDQNMS